MIWGYNYFWKHPHQSPNIQDFFKTKRCPKTAGNFSEPVPAVRRSTSHSWLGIPNEVTASASSDFSKASWKPTNQPPTVATTRGPVSAPENPVSWQRWASTSCVSNEMLPGGESRVEQKLLRSFLITCDSPKTENKKRQKWNVMYPYVTYHQYTIIKSSLSMWEECHWVTVPIFNERSINNLPPSVAHMPLTFRCELEDTSTWRYGTFIQHLDTLCAVQVSKVQKIPQFFNMK